MTRFCHPHHKKGWTVAVFNNTGERILSGGSDGKIKVLDCIDDNSPMEHVIGEKINGLVCKHDVVILATEGTYVNMVQIEDGLPEGLATRFTTEVNNLCLNKDGSKLAACSSDFLIKVVDFQSTEADREMIFEGHTGGVLSVTFDPLDIFLASSSCDGTVRIWRLDNKSTVKSLRVLAPSNDAAFALSPCRLCWESSCGKFLAVPVDKQVCLYERDTWEVLHFLSCASITKPITICCSSQDGALLASGGEDGWMVVWAIETRQPIYRLRDPSESSICSLVWHPQQPLQLLYANANGSLGLVRVPSTDTTQTILSPNAVNALMGCDEEGDTDALLHAAAAQAESSRLVDEDEAQQLLDLPPSDDDVRSIDLSRIKSGFLSRGLDDDDDASQERKEVTDVPTSIVPLVTTAPPVVHRLQKPFQPGSMPLGFRERFMVWNRLGVVTQFRGSGGDNGDDDASNDNQLNEEAAGSIEVEFHDNTLHHSLRLSNSNGYTMADLSLSALLLASPGSNDPTLADDVDAGEHIDPSDISQIAVLPLDTTHGGGAGTDSSSEWTVKLPIGEACDAVCLVPHESIDERGYAVVATSRRLLRIFTQPSPSVSLLRPSAGLHLFQLTQLGLPPISVPGCGVLAMASHPSKPILAVIISTNTAELNWRLYYLGGSMLGSQRDKYPAWLNGSLSTWQLLPISPTSDLSPTASVASQTNSRLMWFGFSDVGGLYTHDATGLLRRLIHGRTPSRPDFHWAPVCDTHSILKPTNRRSDNHFLVGIIESTEVLGSDSNKSDFCGVGQLQTIYCKASKWPRVFPRPVVSHLPFKLPLCALGTDQANLEENYLRFLINEDWPVWGPNLLPEETDEETIDLLNTLSTKCLTSRKAVLLRLFALAAKLESDWASLSIAKLMPDASTVQLAIRYAGRLRRQHLAQRLAGVALEKERENIKPNLSLDEESEEEDDDELPPIRNGASHIAQRPSSSTDPKRHPSGTHSDVINLSLVSSATDETRDEDDVDVDAEPESSALPLPDSEPFSQSTHYSNTQVSSRNPFRENNISKTFAEQGTRHRGSEVFDSWKPQVTEASSKEPSSKTIGRMAKKRPVTAVDGTVKKRPSKINRITNSMHSFMENADSNALPFMDWFDEHRAELEEEYPDKSVEELQQLARSRYEKDHIGKNHSKRNGKENSPPKSGSVGPATKHTGGTNPFADKASKRLSSFKFDSTN